MTPLTINFKPRTVGLTMIELLAVIAVGAVLMAMVLPLASGARRQYSVAATKASWHRYTLALEQFRAEYGAYPQLGGSPVQVNAVPGRFVELMTGHATDGSAPTDEVALAQNPKKLSFLSFAADELTDTGEVQDALGGTTLQLYLDTDGDGFLNGIDGVRGTVGWQSAGAQGTFHSWR